MKKIGLQIYFLTLFLTVVAQGNLFCQQRNFFSQYMFNGLTINPAYAGNQRMLTASMLYRKQWVKINGSPNTQTFTVHNGSKKKRIGYGLMISRDEIGVHKDLSVYGSYSYKIKFKKATLAMGIQGGFTYLTSNYNLLKLDDTYDPLLPNTISGINPNVGTGLFLSNKVSYVGVSIPYIINNNILNKKGEGLVTYGTEERYYLLTAGKVFNINETTKFKPSTLIRLQEEAPVSFDINSNLIFHDIISLGGSYRSGRSMVVIAELGITENFRLGYSYDYAFSALRGLNRGSHEVMLNYRIDLTPEKCHTYF